MVTLATIHSAKGLEWHTVYMPSFIEGHLPTGFSDPSDDPDEERRLMYVLVTRAKSELVLMRPQTTILKGMPAFVNESAFERDIRDLITVDKPMQHRPASGGLGLGMGIKIGVR